MADHSPRVVVVSGHMVDAPNRPRPRFPAARVPAVAEEVRRTFDRWHVGPATTIVTGGARGADIMAAEEAHERGARVRLVLAFPPEEFERRSVALPGTDWTKRFRAVLGFADVEVIDGPDGNDVYARTNAEILRVARQLDPQPHALIVWNGQRGDGSGGTSDFVTQLGDVAAERLRVVDPSPPC